MNIILAQLTKEMIPGFTPFVLCAVGLLWGINVAWDLALKFRGKADDDLTNRITKLEDKLSEEIEKQNITREAQLDRLRMDIQSMPERILTMLANIEKIKGNDRSG